ncbi:MAG: hypothetical protein ACFCUN_06425 [Hyphomicrobiaceae bacterium]
MSRKSFNTMTAATLTATALVSLSGFTTHAADIQDSVFGETPNWTIVRASQGDEFNHCRAIRKQKGPSKIMLARTTSTWIVQFYNPAWALGSALRPTAARLIVDGKTFQGQSGAVGSSYMFNMGRQIESMTPIAKSKSVALVTEDGKKIGYGLRDAQQAIKLVDACVEHAMAVRGVNAAHQDQTPATEAAAEAAPAAAQEPQAPQTPAPRMLGYAETLPIALRYLGQNTSTYEFEAEGQGALKGWAVNWKRPSGVIGAMLIVENAAETVEQLLESRVEVEAKTCAGNFEAFPLQPAKVSDAPAPVSMVMSCTVGERISLVSYQALALAEGVLAMVLEVAILENPAPMAPQMMDL